ncbi:MAG TPA: hypothetical protein VMS18_01995 [Candidatus Binatia bacterium]|nr:hypothetical protein [Candidatus Binatia bacterium]
MIWWFLVLGISTLVVVCVAIALFVHLRKHLQKTHDAHEEALGNARQSAPKDRNEQ